ncbi:hypothetical protein AB1Y20_022342 [Prymnesium parvum]|uniref:Uncharacterized protein n=1 Tax=Prymnesium parvum TaxID=97485 RepID=A0AB34JIJ3_PRYPA
MFRRRGEGKEAIEGQEERHTPPPRPSKTHSHTPAHTPSSRDAPSRMVEAESPTAHGSRGWWRRSAAPSKLSAWDLIYRLRSSEDAMTMPPSRAEVQAIVLAYETTAACLEAMGEREKAADLLQVFLPAFLERGEVAPVWSAHMSLQASIAAGGAPPDTPDRPFFLGDGTPSPRGVPLSIAERVAAATSTVGGRRFAEELAMEAEASKMAADPLGAAVRVEGAAARAAPLPRSSDAGAAAAAPSGGLTEDAIVSSPEGAPAAAASAEVVPAAEAEVQGAGLMTDELKAPVAERSEAADIEVVASDERVEPDVQPTDVASEEVKAKDVEGEQVKAKDVEDEEVKAADAEAATGLDATVMEEATQAARGAETTTTDAEAKEVKAEVEDGEIVADLGTATGLEAAVMDEVGQVAREAEVATIEVEEEGTRPEVEVDAMTTGAEAQAIYIDSKEPGADVEVEATSADAAEGSAAHLSDMDAGEKKKKKKKKKKEEGGLVLGEGDFAESGTAPSGLSDSLAKSVATAAA